MLIQLFLAIMVLATLSYKRYRETPKRSWTTWWMDTSKQGFAMGMQHFVNIVLAIAFAGGQTDASECAWYITNFSITVFCGLFILKGYMKLHRLAVEKYGFDSLRSGDYGQPPRFQVWLVQMLLWCFVSCAEKFITAVCVILPLRGALDGIIALAEAPLKPYPRTELVLVMVVGPTMLNMVFAWVVDNLIKDPDLSHNDQGTKDVECSDAEELLSESSEESLMERKS
jgi:hypothetical protein